MLRPPAIATSLAFALVVWAAQSITGDEEADADTATETQSAAQFAPSAAAAPPVTSSAEALDVEPFQELLRQIILDELKPQYEDRKNWGHQGKVITGVKIKGKWFEPYLEKRTKQVNDGLWQRYVVTLIEPGKTLQVRLDPAAATQPGRMAFSLLLEAKMRGEAHIERWRKGVKMFNVSAVGNLIVEARVGCEVGIRVEPGKLAGTVVLDPRITTIDLRLVDLDLQRVSKLGRDVVHELGDSLTPVVARELDRREPKIVAKANAAIDKRRDRLRFSLDQFLKSGWSKFQSTVVKASTAAKPAQ